MSGFDRRRGGDGGSTIRSSNSCKIKVETKRNYSKSKRLDGVINCLPVESAIVCFLASTKVQ